MSVALVSTVPPRLLQHARNALVAAAVGFAGVSAVSAQAQVPTVNIDKTCRVASTAMVNLSGTSTDDVDICLKAENTAREQIIKDWSAFPASDRTFCVQPRVYLPSYVEWLTCFELNKVVHQLREQGKVMKDLFTTNPDGSYTLPKLP